MEKKHKIILISSLVAGIVGLGIFYNFRKKKIKRQAKLFDGVKEVGNNAGFTNKAFEDMLKSVRW